jgi:hypothetical protein
MKVIIAGGRDITDMDLVLAAVRESGFGISEVVSGNAWGVDRLGEEYAKASNLRLKVFPADWVTFGRSAGPRRNKQMADYADALIAVWDGKSRGTKNMIETMERLGKPVYVHRT